MAVERPHFGGKLPQIEDSAALSARSERAIEESDPLMQVQRLLNERAERRTQLPSMEIPPFRQRNGKFSRSPRLQTDLPTAQASPRTSGFQRTRGPITSDPSHRPQVRSGRPQSLQRSAAADPRVEGVPTQNPSPPAAPRPSPPSHRSALRSTSSFRQERYVSRVKASVEEAEAQRPVSASSPRLYVRQRTHALRPTSAAAYVNETYPHDLTLKTARSFSGRPGGAGAGGVAGAGGDAKKGLMTRAQTWSDLPVSILEEDDAAPSEPRRLASYWAMIRDNRAQLVAFSKLAPIHEFISMKDGGLRRNDDKKTSVDALSAAATAADRRPAVVTSLINDKSQGFADTVLALLHYKQLSAQGQSTQAEVFQRALERTRQEPTSLRPVAPSAPPADLSRGRGGGYSSRSTPAAPAAQDASQASSSGKQSEGDKETTDTKGSTKANDPKEGMEDKETEGASAAEAATVAARQAPLSPSTFTSSTQLWQGQQQPQPRPSTLDPMTRIDLYDDDAHEHEVVHSKRPPPRRRKRLPPSPTAKLVKAAGSDHHVAVNDAVWSLDAAQDSDDDGAHELLDLYQQGGCVQVHACVASVCPACIGK